MEFVELMRRVTDAMRNPGETGDDGVFRLNSEFELLKREFSSLSTGSDEDARAAQEMVAMLEDLQASLSNPDTARSIAESMTGASEPPPEIFEAIDSVDIDAVKAALASKDINQRYGKFDATALYHAMSAMEPSIDIMNLLLDVGADPRLGLADSNVLHGLGFTVFRDISADDLAKVVRRCVELGADIEERTNKLQWTPLISAVSEWNEIATEALLMAGADITARAGQVDGVCFSGADSFAFADGHEPTVEVLRRYRTAH